MPAPPRVVLTLVLLVLASALATAQDTKGAEWIWGSWSDGLDRPAGERCYFRAEVDLAAAPKEAILFAACDDHFVLWVNGKPAGRGDSWQTTERIDLGRLLRAGHNVLAFEGRNDGAPAALLFFGEVALEGGARVRIASGPAVVTFPKEVGGWRDLGFDARAWRPAVSFGPVGSGPWQNLSFAFEARFSPLLGFRVETVAENVGSLIAMTRDERGGILVSVESGGVLRLSDEDGDGRFESVRPFTSAVTYCQGLCWSRREGALFAAGNGPEGPGLYRVEHAADPNDAPRVSCLGRFEGSGGEHGVHGVVEGPDGRLYVAVGNHHRVAAPASARSPFRLAYEGGLLPLFEDPLGHAVGIPAPGGVVASVDPQGKEWRVFAGGFRNHYDLAFDARGELFTYDSDMEWDVGLPWYRPVRFVHVIPGGEYGWRRGSWTWPDWYSDSLPAAADVGRGSPTGLVCYGAKRFPARFRGAILGADWSQGQILAYHPEPRGASYGGSVEVLLQGHPLNVTDLEVDGAGALLFTTGGRGTHGGLYRLVYDGADEPDPPKDARPPFDWRFEKGDPEAGLRSDDRFVRFAAARALERSGDRGRLLALAGGADERAAGEALVALARTLLASPDPNDGKAAFSAGLALAKRAATAEARLAALRALELLLLAPAPPPDAALADDAKNRLLAAFPSGERRADRLLAELLGRLAPRGSVGKLLAALEADPSRAEQIHFANALRCIRESWSDDERGRFLRWLAGARAWTGGASFPGYVDAIAREAKPLFAAAAWRDAGLDAPNRPAPPPPVALSAGEPKDYDATLAFLGRAIHADRRSLAEGALVFRSLCAQCHLYRDEGGRSGPELTTVASRFSLADQLDAVLRPSRVVSSQYQAWVARRKGGDLVSGIRALDDAQRLVLVQGDGTLVTIPRGEVAESEASPLSLMPDGLLDALSLEQVADLFAFLDSKDASPALARAEWRPLFDGRSLEGWDHDPRLWGVEGGSIAGRASGLPGSRFLVFQKRVADFTVEFDVMLEKGNSGLQFRAEQPEPLVLTGYQADIGQSYWGSLYEEGGRGMLAQVANEIWTSIVQPKGWNHYVVDARGDRIRIELNGVTTVDLRDDRAKDGFLGFQLHAGVENRVWFRNLRLRP